MRFLTLILILIPVSLIAEPGIKTGRLSNGMEVVLVENHSVPMAAANIVVKAGARDETWNTWGAAHFLEHLLFNGTKTRTQEVIYDEFDRIGAYHNAHTGSHFTDFMTLVGKDNFGVGFDILADMVFNSTLPEEKFEKERGIVIEEIARSNTNDDGVQRQYAEILFGSSPLSREVLGTTESIAALDRDSVMAFYRRWYRPNNALLFATGDFDADTLFDWFDRRLSLYPPAEIPPRKVIAPPDFSAFAAIGLIEKTGGSRTRQLNLSFAAPMPGEDDFIPFMLLLKALDKRFGINLPAGVTAGSDLLIDPDLAVATLTISAPADNIEADLAGYIDAELKRLLDKPVDSGEISRLARNYIAEQVYNTERLHYYGMLNAQFWAVVSWDEFSSWNERMAKVTPEMLKTTAKKWLLTPNRLTVTFTPQSSTADSASDTPVSLMRRHNSGEPTIIVRSDPTARVFAVHILAKDRWLWDRRYQPGAVDLLHRTLGEASMPGGKLGDRLESISATLKTADSPAIPYDDYYTAPEYSFIRMETLPEKWREAIDILAELLWTTPLTDKQIETAKEGVAAGSAAGQRSPSGIGLRKIRENLAGAGSLAAPVYGDVVSLTIDDMQNLRKDYLHPENLIITVAGPISGDETADFIARVITSRVKATFVRPPDLDKPIRTLRSVSLRDTIVLGKPQGAVVKGKVLDDISFEDRAALTIANAWFSDRMGMVLRETRGLAYSLGSSISFQRDKEGKIWGLWEISIGTRPERLPESETGIDELLNELQTHEFTAKELEKINAAIAGRLMMRDMSRIGQAFAMGVGEFLWDDPESRAHLIEALESTTPEKVRAVAGKHLGTNGLTTIIVK